MLHLSDTPSGGVDEVLRALYLSRGHDGVKVDPTRLLRHLPPHVSVADVTTVLEAQVTAGHVAKSNGFYGLTSTGVTFSRAHKPRHGRLNVV